MINTGTCACRASSMPLIGYIIVERCRLSALQYAVTGFRPLDTIGKETYTREHTMGCLDIPNETVFTMEMTPVKVGPGATDEVAYDLKRLGVKHALIITDRGVMKIGLPERARSLIQDAGIKVDIFDEVHVEP